MNTPEALQAHWQAEGLTWPEAPVFAAGVRHALVFSPFLARELQAQAAAFAERLPRLLQADASFDPWVEWPRWLPEQPMPVRLRRFRRFHAAVLAWRDFTGLDDVPRTLADLSRLAECCIEQALLHCERELSESFGRPLDAEGRPQRLTVLGMGKLGGRELNFSSDIDLIFCYREQGRTDGARSLENEQWFLRLGQRLIRLLDEVTDEGFVYRVDMRLRPYGKAGRLALSHAAMETYYETQGRMWERYALIKARPVAGDLQGGRELLQRLQPFVYRRYLDYTAFDELAEMKRSIHAQYRDDRLARNIKLGPGGIREVEFIVQSFQLIWGGRINALRQPPLEPALDALAHHRLLQVETAEGLRAAYRFLRRLENHLQARDDTQTQSLPEERPELQALAESMGRADADSLLAELENHRQVVRQQFARVFDQGGEGENPWQQTASRLLLALDEGHTPLPVLERAGFADARALSERLQRWWQSPAHRQTGPRGQQRLRALFPHLLQAAASAERPTQALEALLELVQTVARRSAYLALLQNHRPALCWLQAQLLASQWIRQQLLEYPLLLDEMLEWQTHASLDPPERWRADLDRMLAALPADDEEQAMVLLRQFTRSRKLQIAVLELQGALQAVEAARQLACLAEVVLLQAMKLAQAQIERRHGRLSACGPLRLLAYGSLAAGSLSYESDLDLVFLYRCDDEQAMSDGPRPLPAAVYQVRLAQRFVHLLTTRTTAGQLYEIDLRLRPNGNAGLLVSTFSAYARYQREKSWTWEQQALVKTRLLGEAEELGQDFDTLRREVLARPRDRHELAGEIRDMRRRIREEKPPPARGFHLKLSPGGMTDLDFLLQYAVLAWSHDHPNLLDPVDLAGLLQAVLAAGLIEEPAFDQTVLENLLHGLHAAHLACRQPVVDAPPAGSDGVRALWQAWLGGN